MDVFLSTEFISEQRIGHVTMKPFISDLPISWQDFPGLSTDSPYGAWCCRWTIFILYNGQHLGLNDLWCVRLVWNGELVYGFYDVCSIQYFPSSPRSVTLKIQITYCANT